MTSIYRPPSSSRSLPPLPPDALDRGRAKTRINTDPDAYAHLRTPSGTLSISLPPIRPSARGSKDEGGPLPGISSIIDQSEIPYEHTRPARRLSETRAYPPPRDWESRHSPSAWTLRPQRVDSISTTDGSQSRPSSPDVSAMSSSTSSLSSILEDRSACTSPGPIPRFAIGSRLPPLGPPQSAFELSDLRTSLPSDESGTRRSGPSRTPVFRSPRSTPLPASRPMSPAIQLSPRMRPLARRLRGLAVGEDRVMSSESPEAESVPQASVKSEPETDSAPSSPRSKGLSETDLLAHEQVLSRGLVVEPYSEDQVPSEQRDEQMACTPTQPDPKLPLPWMDTESSTPTGPPSPPVRSPSSAATPPTEDEDSKSGIVKQSESETETETEDERELSYEERRAKLRAANSSPINANSVRTRGGANYHWLISSGYSSVPTLQPPDLFQLQQQVGRFGRKPQPDPIRQPITTQSQLLMQMAERQSQIERLQMEQEEAATALRLTSSLSLGSPSIDQQFGPFSIPELTPPPLPLGLSPIPGPPPVVQQHMYIPEPPIVPDLTPALDLSQFSAPTGAYTDLAPAPSRYSDLPPTPFVYPDPHPSLSPPGLTATSSATSASSPSDSFYLSPPPPPSLSTHAMPTPTRTTYNKDLMEFKAHEMMGFQPDMIPEDEAFLPGSSTSVIPPAGSGTHKCQSCGKTFRRPSGLKDHMNIHSGEKPYCCPLETCRKGFATRSNMIRHHNKTHPSRPKIGGVADIGNELDEVQAVEALDPTSPTESGGSSSQGRFRVVQQSTRGVKEPGVGPVRSTKERRTMRKHTVSGAPPTIG